ncbi:MAG: hypothetical protein AB1609_08800 [Bacillota bacterium]
MRLGAVVAEDRDTVVPLSEGPTCAIVETDTGEVTYLPNPAVTARGGRRAAVTRFFVESGVEAVLSVPGTFCERSHQLARDSGLQFIPVEAGTRLGQLLADPAAYLGRRTASLSPSMLHRHDHPRGEHGHTGFDAHERDAT